MGTIRFSEALLRAVIAVMQQYPAGVSVATVTAAVPATESTVSKICRMLSADVHTGGLNTARALFRLRPDHEAVLQAHRRLASNAMQEPVGIDGVCVDCTCKPQPSQFAMRNGRPYLPACPKRSTDRNRTPWTLVAETGPMLRSQVPVPIDELRRRAVLRAVRTSEDPLSEVELQRATQLTASELRVVLAQLLQQGAVSRFIRTRPGQPPMPLFAIRVAVTDPRRAS